MTVYPSLMLGGPFDGEIRTGDTEQQPDSWSLALPDLESFSLYRISVGVFDVREGEVVQVYQWVGSESPMREAGVEI